MFTGAAVAFLTGTQHNVTLSTIEAAYVAMRDYAKAVLYCSCGLYSNSCGPHLGDRCKIV